MVWRFIVKQVLIVFFVFFASSCATLSESACKQGNWEDIGHEDGMSGKKLSVIHDHTKACLEYGIKVDANIYKKGYSTGLALYCDPEKAFDLGYSGANYQNVCKSKKFNSDYTLGHKIFTLKSELQSVGVEIERLRNDLEESNISSYVKSKESLKKEMKDLKIKQSQLKKKLLILTVKSGRNLEDLVEAI